MFQFPAGSNTAALTTAVARPLASGLTGGGFDPLSLNPLLAYETSASMLAAGGGAAANLDLVATLDNRVSGGVDATQTTSSYQPRAHVPLGDGHLHLPGVSGNYAKLAAGVNLGTQTEILIGVKVRTWSPSDSQALFDQYPASLMVWLRSTGKLQLYFGTSANIQTATGIPASAPLETVIKIVRDGTDASTEVFYKDHDGSFTSLGSATLGAVGSAPTGSSQELSLGRWRSGNQKYADCSYQTLKVTADSTVTLDLDMSDGAHKASSFTCASGQTVTISKSGLDPATIIRRNVLRFDGANSYVGGTFGSDLNTAHAFIKFAVNGDVFSTTGPSTMSVYRTHHWLTNAANFFLGSGTTSVNARTYIGATVLQQNGKWNDDNGTIVSEVSISDGAHFSKVNNANLLTDSRAYSLNANKFRIGAGSTGGHAPMDVEQIYLFDRVLSAAESAKMYNYVSK